MQSSTTKHTGDLHWRLAFWVPIVTVLEWGKRRANHWAVPIPPVSPNDLINERCLANSCHCRATNHLQLVETRKIDR